MMTNRVTAALVCVFAACASNALALTPLAHVEEHGNGKTPMVLIPGLACDWSVWEDFMERNGDEYTMYAVTLPGMAGTEAPPMPDAADTGTPWVDNAIEAIAELITKRELEGAVVVGHSLGGHVAARFGIEHPELCATAISVDGFAVAPIAWDQTGQARRDAIEAGFVQQIRGMGDMWFAQFRAQMTMIVDDPARAKELTDMMGSTETSVALQYVIELFRSDIREGLMRTDTPTLFLAADSADEGVGLGHEFWEQTAGAGKNVTVEYIERSGHFIMDDQPEALSEAVREFVEK